MKITNKYNLPTAMVNALTKGTKYGGSQFTGVYRVIQLCDAPQVVCLKRLHFHEIEEDASDRLWALLGDSVHYILGQTKNVGKDALAEERLRYELPGRGVTVTGQSDLYTEDGFIDDYKVTSVWSVLRGVKIEWEAQLNLYALLWQHSGFEVKGLRIRAILRDWQRSKVNGTDYPPCPFVTLPVKLWTKQEQLIALGSMVDAHEKARLTGAPECTPEQQWAKPDTWAVTKLGNKRADRVLDSADRAEAYRVQVEGVTGKKFAVTHRPGGAVRCAEYCPVNRWCPQWIAMQNTANAGEALDE